VPKPEKARPLPGAPRQPAPARPPAEELPRVREAQSRLNANGYSCGAPDGQLGEGTRECLRRFQRDAGVPVTGTPDAATLEALDSL
jgi:peptidoglycan hydrolase-like protein with peptidoglycan-binding domain